MVLRCLVLSMLVAGSGLACSIPDDPFPMLETPPPPPPDGEPAPPDGEPAPPDSAAFAVLSVTPGDGDVEVARDVAITMQFNAAVDPETLEHLHVDDAAGAPVPGAWSASDDTATFTPGPRLGRVRRYTIGASTELRDVAGRPLSTALVAGFTTRDGAWSAPVMAQSADVFSAESPRVVCHADGTFDLAWTQQDSSEELRHVVARRHTADGWGGVVVVSPPGAWLADLAANRRRGAVAMWLDSELKVGASRLRTGFPWHVLATRGLPYSSRGGPQRVALSDGDDVFLLWSAGLGPMAARFTTDEGWDSDVPLQERTDAVHGDLAVSAQGGAAAAWVESRGLVSRVFDPGPSGGWRAESDVHTGAAAQDLSLGSDASGNLILVWWEHRQGRGEVLGRHREMSGAWQGIGSLGLGWSPRLAVDASGTALVTWWAEGEKPRLVARLYRPGVGWAPPKVVALGGFGPYRVAVAGEEATVVGTVDDPAATTAWSVRHVGGQWQAPVRLDDSAVNSTAAVAACPDGTAAAVWMRREELERGTIWMSRFE